MPRRTITVQMELDIADPNESREVADAIEVDGSECLEAGNYVLIKVEPAVEDFTIIGNVRVDIKHSTEEDAIKAYHALNERLQEAVRLWTADQWYQMDSGLTTFLHNDRTDAEIDSNRRSFAAGVTLRNMPPNW